jgi:hypothetical protein
MPLSVGQLQGSYLSLKKDHEVDPVEALGTPWLDGQILCSFVLINLQESGLHPTQMTIALQVLGSQVLLLSIFFLQPYLRKVTD